MKELLIKEGNSIACFKKDDIITRLCPSENTKEIYNDNLMITQTIQAQGDRSYIGCPLKLIGIFNNQIWLSRMLDIEKRIFGERPIRLDLDQWSDGWSIFEIPDGFSIENL